MSEVIHFKSKKQKARFAAILLTFIIAMLYILFSKGSLYKFNGFKQEINPASSFIKDATQEVSKDIEKGKSVINKK
jgi:hypothetical protein